jgi:YD repeat-containing protein
MSIDDLRQSGLLEDVEPDVEGARVVLDECDRHLESATLIADIDPTGAYQLAYDAARKAIGAHLRAAGLRIPSDRPGGHATTGRYGVLAIAGAADDLQAFDRMRRRRNRSEYGVAPAQPADVNDALGHARAIVAAVRADVG